MKTQPNFWYKPEYHTTRTSDYMAGESEFCRFLEMKLQNSQNPILAVQKKLFKKLDCTPFLARRLRSKYFLDTLCL